MFVFSLALQSERLRSAELVQDRDDLASLVIDLENSITELDRDFQLFKLNKRSPPASPEAKGAEAMGTDEDDILQDDLLLTMESELRALRKERANLLRENRLQSKKIDEYEDVINSQQSEMMELSRRVKELESSRDTYAQGKGSCWRQAGDRKNSDSPLIQKWRGGHLPEGLPPPSRSLLTKTIVGSGTGTGTVSDPGVFDSDSRSLFSNSDGDDTGSDATLEVLRRIPERPGRPGARRPSLGSSIICGIRERAKAVWGTTAPPIHPLVVTESVYLGDLED